MAENPALDALLEQVDQQIVKQNKMLSALVFSATETGERADRAKLFDRLASARDVASSIGSGMLAAGAIGLAAPRMLGRITAPVGPSSGAELDELVAATVIGGASVAATFGSRWVLRNAPSWIRGRGVLGKVLWVTVLDEVFGTNIGPQLAEIGKRVAAEADRVGITDPEEWNKKFQAYKNQQRLRTFRYADKISSIMASAYREMFSAAQLGHPDQVFDSYETARRQLNLLWVKRDEGSWIAYEALILLPQQYKQLKSDAEVRRAMIDAHVEYTRDRDWRPEQGPPPPPANRLRISPKDPYMSPFMAPFPLPSDDKQGAVVVPENSLTFNLGPALRAAAGPSASIVVAADGDWTWQFLAPGTNVGPAANMSNPPSDAVRNVVKLPAKTQPVGKQWLNFLRTMPQITADISADMRNQLAEQFIEPEFNKWLFDYLRQNGLSEAEADIAIGRFQFLVEKYDVQGLQWKREALEQLDRPPRAPRIRPTQDDILDLFKNQKHPPATATAIRKRPITVVGAKQVGRAVGRTVAKKSLQALVRTAFSLWTGADFLLSPTPTGPTILDGTQREQYGEMVANAYFDKQSMEQLYQSIRVIRDLNSTEFERATALNTVRTTVQRLRGQLDANSDTLYARYHSDNEQLGAVISAFGQSPDVLDDASTIKTPLYTFLRTVEQRAVTSVPGSMFDVDQSRLAWKALGYMAEDKVLSSKLTQYGAGSISILTTGTKQGDTYNNKSTTTTTINRRSAVPDPISSMPGLPR